MNIEVQRRILNFVVTVLAFVIAACTPTATPAPSGIENIHVDTVSADENLAETETFRLPNCGGTSELDQTLGSSASILKSVTIGAKATTEGSGEVSIPQTAKLQLKVAVEAAYQQTYESANSRLDTIGMKAAPGTSVIYEIGWYEQTFSSTVEYSENNEVYQVPYTYKLRVPKIDNSYQTACEDVPGPQATDPPQPTERPQQVAPTTAVEEPRLEVGQAWEQDGQSLTLDNVVLTLESGNWSPAHLGVSFVFNNHRNNDALFSVTHTDFFFKDSLGNIGDADGWGWPCYTDNWEVNVPAGGTLQTIDCQHVGTDGVSNNLYDRLIWFDVDITDQRITEVTITVRQFSRITNARWRIEIPH